MQMQWKSISRRLLIASVGLLLPLAAHQASAATINGTLSVTATVQSYFTVAFSGTDVTPNATGNSGGTTATAAVAFGNINAAGTGLASGVTLVSANTTLGSCSTSCFEVATPLTITVTAYNATSTSYTITAALTAADATNGWAIGSTPATALTTTPGTVSNGGTFTDGTPESVNVYLAVPVTAQAGAAPSATIDLVFTAE